MAWIACALLVPPASAVAAPAVVGFDDLPAGTAIGAQYEGLRFGERPATGAAGGAFVATASGQARSAPNVAMLAYDAFDDFSSSWIKFDKQQSQVVLHACRSGMPSGPQRPNYNVLAYDSNGTEIANLQGIECDLNGALVPVTVSSTHISYLNVYGAGRGWVIDDLQFEVDPSPPPPPPKDFSFTFADAPASQTIAIRPGETTKRTLVIDRNESSFGPIRVYLSPPPPPGVHIAFTPSIPSSSSDDLVTMQVPTTCPGLPMRVTLRDRRACRRGSTSRPASVVSAARLDRSHPGACRGVGAELALACELRFASLERTAIAQPEVSHRLVPGGDVIARLSRLAGGARALEVILGSVVLDGATAEASPRSRPAPTAREASAQPARRTQREVVLDVALSGPPRGPGRAAGRRRGTAAARARRAGTCWSCA